MKFTLGWLREHLETDATVELNDDGRGLRVCFRGSGWTSVIHEHITPAENDEGQKVSHFL